MINYLDDDLSKRLKDLKDIDKSYEKCGGCTKLALLDYRMCQIRRYSIARRLAGVFGWFQEINKNNPE